MKSFNPIIEVEDDGLYIPEVRRWSEEKYNLLGAYMDIFTTSMCKSWNQLVYIDMFAGAGFSRIKSTGKVLKSSAFIALSLPIPFTKYIFCEADPQRFEALRRRIGRDYGNKDISLIFGDVNENVNKVQKYIPRFGSGNTLLSFAFVDPFSLNLKYSTIKSLGKKLNIDFLILLALGMDANRNFQSYLSSNSKKIADFIDNSNWKEEASDITSSKDFIRYLSEQYDKNMKDIGYVEPEEKQLIKSHTKNLSLYYLAFYSKHLLGNKFWKEMRKYTDNQLDLFS